MDALVCKLLNFEQVRDIITHMRHIQCALSNLYKETQTGMPLYMLLNLPFTAAV